MTDQHRQHRHHAAPRSFEEELADFRARKDAFFATSHQSPLPHDRRHGFRGLRYFAPSRAHRIEGVRLEPDPDPERTTEIVTSDEKTRTAWRVGTFEFAAPGGHGQLAAYTFGAPAGHEHEPGHEPDEPGHEAPLELFVPFRDATNGRETYGAGRYLEVTPDERGSFTLDFNLAYNPWCAYAPQYSCPLPPRENWLPFRIEAGEQVPDDEEVS